jgi:hypothetical protein
MDGMDVCRDKRWGLGKDHDDEMKEEIYYIHIMVLTCT